MIRAYHSHLVGGDDDDVSLAIGPPPDPREERYCPLGGEVVAALSYAALRKLSSSACHDMPPPSPVSTPQPQPLAHRPWARPSRPASPVVVRSRLAARCDPFDVVPVNRPSRANRTRSDSTSTDTAAGLPLLHRSVCSTVGPAVVAPKSSGCAVVCSAAFHTLDYPSSSCAVDVAPPPVQHYQQQQHHHHHHQQQQQQYHPPPPNTEASDRTSDALMCTSTAVSQRSGSDGVDSRAAVSLLQQSCGTPLPPCRSVQPQDAALPPHGSQEASPTALLQERLSAASGRLLRLLGGEPAAGGATAVCSPVMRADGLSGAAPDTMQPGGASRWGGLPAELGAHPMGYPHPPSRGRAAAPFTPNRGPASPPCDEVIVIGSPEWHASSSVAPPPALLPPVASAADADAAALEQRLRQAQAALRSKSGGRRRRV